MRFTSVGVGLKSLLLTKIVIVFIAVSSAKPNTMNEANKGKSLLAKPLYEFGSKLLNELNKGDSKGNLIISPISMHQALSMVMLGADHGSETKRQIKNTLGYSTLDESQIELVHQTYADLMKEFARINNEARLDRARKNDSDEENVMGRNTSPILDMFTTLVTHNHTHAKPDYVNNIKKYYNSTISNIQDAEPETKKTFLKRVNDWGKEVGFSGPIMDESSLDGDWEAILMASIQVEAFWFDQFSEYDSKDIFYNYGYNNQPIHGTVLSSGDLRRSPVIEFTSNEKATWKEMHKRMASNPLFQKLSDLNFRAAMISLIGDVSLIILEPVREISDVSSSGMANARLNKLASELSSDLVESEGKEKHTKLEAVMKLLDENAFNNNMDFIQIPKFKFENDISPKSALQSLGLRHVFDDKRAQISNITMDPVHISDIKHKAMIETTKGGIKAAAVTLIRFQLMSALIESPRERIKYFVENPFMFVIRYKDVPLFVGRLTNLSEKNGN